MSATTLHPERDAMLVSLNIRTWTGRRQDETAIRTVHATHDCHPKTGAYSKRLLTKPAFAAITRVVSDARAAHYTHTMPWDEPGRRLLPVILYDTYMARMGRLIDRLFHERDVFIHAYEDNITEARRELGTLFNPSEYPLANELRDKISMHYRIEPVPIAENFVADLRPVDRAHLQSQLAAQVKSRLDDALKDLYRRLGDALLHVADRIDTDAAGKPLVFRDTLITNLRDLVGLIPALNIFADQRLADLVEQARREIAAVDPSELRPSAHGSAATRAHVRRNALLLAQQVATRLGSPDLQQAA